MIKIKLIIILSFHIFFILLPITAKGDILEKYLKQDETTAKNLLPEKKEQIKHKSNISERINNNLFTIKKRNALQVNFSLGANRNHLANKLYLSQETYENKKFSPLIGLKIEYNDTRRSFSNLSFSLGLKYVLFRFYDAEITASYEQELENWFNIPLNKDIYTLLTSTVEIKLSYEVTPNFIVYSGFNPKYSWVTDSYLAKAPDGMKEEIRQYIDFSYGFLIRR